MNTNHSQILVFLIVFFAVIVAMGVSFLYSGRSRTNIIAVQIDRTQAEEASRSGTDIGLRKVTEDKCIAWPGASLTIGGAEVDITVAETTQEYNITSYATKGRAHSTVSETVTKPEIIGWAKAYGTSSNERFNTFQQTLDGGYIFGGITQPSAGGRYFLVVKTNSKGEVGAPSVHEWTKIYGGSGEINLRDLKQISDGDYIFGGDTYAFQSHPADVGPTHILLIKINAQGDSAGGWAKVYGAAADYDRVRAIQPTADSGYILGGSTSSYTPVGVYDFLVLKVDSNGNLDSSFGNLNGYGLYGGADDDYLNSIQATSDGGYIFGGNSKSLGAPGGLNDFLVVKTDSRGRVTGGDCGGAAVCWASRYGGADGDNLIKILNTTDGGYILAGETYTFGPGGAAFLVVKTDRKGRVTEGDCGVTATCWARTYGGSGLDNINDFRQTSAGYIIEGGTTSFTDEKALVIKITSGGEMQWAKTYEGMIDQRLDCYSAIQQTPDGYIIGGITDIFGAGGDDLLVIKTDLLGELDCCSGIYQDVTAGISVNDVTSLLDVTVVTDDIIVASPADFINTITDPAITDDVLSGFQIDSDVCSAY